MRTQLNYFLKISRKIDITSNPLAIILNTVIRTIRQRKPNVYLPIISKNIPPCYHVTCLNMDCYPAYQLTTYSCTPPPPR